MRFARSPDRADNPAESGENHIHNRTYYENLNRAPLAEFAEDHAEQTIANAEYQPPDKARRQQMPREAQKSKDWNSRKETENRRCGDIALHGKAIQERGVVGNHQASGKDQCQADADIHARADSSVAEGVKPTISGQMRTYQHALLGSQETSNRLTRGHGDGCVTSTATGVLGALSFPARSTAVTVYQ